MGTIFVKIKLIAYLLCKNVVYNGFIKIKKGGKNHEHRK